MRLLGTGGMGFIGSNFIRHMLAAYDDITIINFDKLSYGSNPATVANITTSDRYRFVKGDINDPDLVKKESENVEAIVNIAAETARTPTEVELAPCP